MRWRDGTYSWIATMAVALMMIVMTVALMTVLSLGRGISSLALEPRDIGYRDFSFSARGVNLDQEVNLYQKISHGPTGEKPQSKLWFSDGLWWGILFDRSTEEYHIYRHDEATHAWSDTGTVVDERNSSRADALWDGTHLYVASAGPTSAIGSDSARVLRYSYDAASNSYSLDVGFPVIVSSGGMEAIVLAKDTAGELWVTYTQNDQVYVNHTLGDDASWSRPFVLPVQGTTVAHDDISSIVAFGSQVGVMWSNQSDSTFYFATHGDGEPADAWQARAAVQGPGVANDHINLKADSSGRVFAAVKTRRDQVNPDQNAPYSVLLVRDQEGNWTSYTFGRVSDSHTRPIVLLDEEHRYLYVLATSSCCEGGTVYYKRTDLDNISFVEGRGVPFIQRTTDLLINDATSTKQNLNGDTGLLALASDGPSGYYLHNEIDLNAVDVSSPVLTDGATNADRETNIKAELFEGMNRST